MRNVTDHAITEFVGIYDADSTTWGEISYWIGARIGRRHCSLCDITHGVFTKKKEWRECSLAIGIPFIAYHRNNAPHDSLAVAQGRFPVVLARRGTEIMIALDDKELTDCNGSPHELVARLTSLL